MVSEQQNYRIQKQSYYKQTTNKDGNEAESEEICKLMADVGINLIFPLLNERKTNGSPQEI